MVAAGLIGSFGPAVVTELDQALGGRLRVVHATADSRLLLAGPRHVPYASSSAGRCFAWGQELPGAGESLDDVLARRECPGFVDEPARVIVHAGVLGVHDVYYRALGDAVAFATSIDPLARLTAGSAGSAGARLHVDWQSWAGTWCTLHPLGGGTPFREVRRLLGAESLVWDRGRRRWRVETRRPHCWDVEPGTAGPEDVAQALREATSRRLGAHVELTLSGGWDSRALLLATGRDHTSVRAWTTYPDDGLDRDVALAAMIAERLGLPHTVVPTDDRPWPADAAWVHERLEFQSPWHTWLARLSQRLADRTDPVLDGLAGDQLVKGRIAALISPAEDGRQRPQAALRPLLVRPPLDLLAPAAVEWLRAACEDAFGAAVADLEGSPAATTHAVLRTRTARGTGPSPMRLFGPDRPVALPFLDPDVVTASLQVPLAAKSDGRFYRAVLEALDPDVAALPSTNDRGGDAGPVRPVRQAGADAAAFHAERLGHLRAVDGLLGGTARIGSGDEASDVVRRLLVRRNGWLWLNGLSAFAGWLERYADRLAAVRAPWLS